MSVIYLYETTEELFGAAFLVQSVPRTRTSSVSCEKVAGQYGCEDAS
jgi:hypothetical protein